LFRPTEAGTEALDVLFIEDDPDVAEMYRLKLELDGYWVRVVNSATAVAAARASCPDILFLDLSSGLAERLHLLRDIRMAVGRPSLPAIVLAPSDQEVLRKPGVHLSANDYFVRVATGKAPSLLVEPSSSLPFLDGRRHLADSGASYSR
jgi:DNA-binding response OmpR family regulator